MGYSVEAFLELLIVVMNTHGVHDDFHDHEGHHL